MGSGIAATFAAIVVLAAAVMIGADFLGLPSWVNPSFERTAVGEQRAVALEDGSLIQLNTATRLTVSFGPAVRRVSLAAGEARFTVARDPDRPFIVSTPQASVRAVGTIFNVRTAASGTSVAVLQGHVEVAARAGEGIDSAPAVASASGAAGQSASSGSRPGAAAPSGGWPGGPTPRRIDLYIGQRAAVSPMGRILIGAGPSLERVRAWTEGRLVFRDEPLADLVAEFNRYHVQPLRIVDPRLAGVRVSGTFAADDLASFEQFLERYEGVDVRAAPDGSELLERAAATH